MKPIEFDWKEGTTSIVWEEPTCGIVRLHIPGDTDEHPQYRGVCFVKVGYKYKFLQNIIRFLQILNLGTDYEFKAMVTPKGEEATREEHRHMKGYLTSLGLKGFSRRLKDGKVVVKKY